MSRFGCSARGTVAANALASRSAKQGRYVAEGRRRSIWFRRGVEWPDRERLRARGLSLQLEGAAFRVRMRFCDGFVTLIVDEHLAGSRRRGQARSRVRDVSERGEVFVA